MRYSLFDQAIKAHEGGRPNLFLSIFFNNIGRKLQFMGPDGAGDPEWLARGLDLVIEIYKGYEAQAPENLNIKGVRAYFRWINPDKEEPGTPAEFDRRMITWGLRESDRDKYLALLKDPSKPYAPATDEGKEYLAALLPKEDETPGPEYRPTPWGPGKRPAAEEISGPQIAALIARLDEMDKQLDDMEVLVEAILEAVSERN